jgi:malonate transporter
MPDDFGSTLAFAFSVTAPIFVMVALGIVLRAWHAINEEFIRVASRLVFNVGLPVILFTSTATRDLSQLVQIQHIVAAVLTAFVIFLLASLTARWQVTSPRDKGVLVQGAFRGNLVIIGIAFCANAYGEEGVAYAALPVAALIVVYNVFSVYTLTTSLQDNSRRESILAFVQNPLIIGIAVGLLTNLLTSYFNQPLPQLALDTSRYLGQMTLPLALLCIGGALNLEQLHHIQKPAVAASVWKLILSPLVLLAVAWPLGIRGAELGVLFLLAASPSATAGFVMVKAMGGNAELAAKIVLTSTLGSLFTVTTGLWLLKGWGII